MSWLERLKKAAVTPCALPAETTELGLVGFAGYLAALSQNSAGGIEAANDAAPPPDPDRNCWPHTTAMNTEEIDTFTQRLARFTDKGMGLDEAERLADKLVMRDRQPDDWWLCIECSHLAGAGRWSCGNAARADVSAQGLARELVTMPQRCNGFTA